MHFPYRLRQFWKNVNADLLSDSALEDVAGALDAGECALFMRMSDQDQRHAYSVYRLLRDSGQTDRNLLAAALLHDVGKARVPITVWDRTLAVLVETLAPGTADRWGEGEPVGWKRPFVVRKHHARWGAQFAEDAGSEEVVRELIRNHQDMAAEKSGEVTDLLRLLQWADDQL